MSRPVNSGALSTDFEFRALSEANNYRAALAREFAPFLSGKVIEIGAGVGQMTQVLQRAPGITDFLAVEPDSRFHSAFAVSNPNTRLFKGIARDVPERNGWNTLVSINVLEHIEDDTAELREWHTLLSEAGGHLCLFVPARPEIYAPLDKDFGHFRRYTKPRLRIKLQEAGFKIRSIRYFNSLGYFAWWFSFCLFQRRSFDVRSVRAYDRLIFPVIYALESRICRPPFGQSLIVVAFASQGREEQKDRASVFASR
jgi:SAM-dependent methyltransferase